MAEYEEDIVVAEEDGYNRTDINALDRDEIDPLQIAREAFRTSTDYMEASVRKQWERNLYLFRSKHPPGSKYHSSAYKYRSKIFRPKTRATIRRHEAAAAAAYFSTRDLILLEPENENDPNQQAFAQVTKQALQQRLDDSIPWFQIVIGAYQEAMVHGTVASKQYWNYDEVAGKDEPVVELVPIENIRFDQAAKWTDPVNTSPYVIHMIPMYIYQIKDRMASGEWTEYETSEIANSMRHNYDPTRYAREGDRTDSKEPDTNIQDFDIGWVHENFVDMDGIDMVYYTLGTEYMLSDPIPVTDIYPQGRPFVLGKVEIEAHRLYPAGVVELSEQLQVEANDVANQRLDNIKLALNKRYFARRTGNIDYKSLTHNVPGSVTLMDDINNDVRVESTPDVTGSSYQEQDRLSTDFDEISGSFSLGSIANNRAMNETVGGMNLLNADADQLAEFQLRVFSETWVEPVLKQLVVLMAKFETDERIIQIAGEGAGLPEPAQDWMLTDQVHVRVLVGIGSTNPQKRIENLTMAVGTVTQFMPETRAALVGQEFIKEIMGAAGFRDGGRFYNFEKLEDPQIQEMQKKLQEMQQVIEQKQIEQQGRMAVEKLKQDAATQRQQMKEAEDQSGKQAQNYLMYMDRMIAAEKNVIEREKMQIARDQAALAFEQQEKDRVTKENQALMAMLSQQSSRFNPNGGG